VSAREESDLVPTPRVRFGTRVGEVATRLARELIAARAVAGLTQRQVARRAGVSQALVSQVERGQTTPSLDVMHRLAAATGYDLSFRLFPADGVRLRDSGQLRVAEVLRAAAHPAWRVRLEVPVGTGRDRRAIDLVLDAGEDMIAVEIERALLDLQAQLRSAQLKRAAFAEGIGRAAWLVLAVPDTYRNRTAVETYRTLISAALPVPSRRIWARLRSGGQLDGDGLVWVRAVRTSADKPG
jgi:transcriptional regulator with XRE-family HTH domain